MAGFEDVIVRALEKEQSDSATVREQVYNSARATLVNMLNKSGKLSPENIFEQQQKLEAAIANIELHYTPIEASSPPAIPSVEIDEGSFNQVAHAGNQNAQAGFKPFWRRPFSLLLLGATLFAALGISAWWIYDQELTKPAELRDNSVPNPPKILAEESSEPDDDTKTVGEQINTGWIAIFETSDPIGLITPAASTAKLSKDDSGSFIRLKSASGDLQRRFQFVVDPGIIEAVRSKNAVFEIIAKSSDRDSQQFIVTCQLGVFGDCGRNQFTTSSKPKKFTIKKTFENLEPAGAQPGGTISVIVDISGQGAPLDVYVLRVMAR